MVIINISDLQLIVALSPILEKLSGSKELSCHAGHQKVGRCCTTGESGESQVMKYASEGMHGGFWNPEQMTPEVQNKNASGPTKKNWCPPKKDFYILCFLRLNTSAIFRTCNFRLTGGVGHLSGNLAHQLLIEVKLSINALPLHGEQK